MSSSITRMLAMTAMSLAAACLRAPSAPEPPRASPGEGLHVLFIGNSLTYVNVLPEIVSALADSAGGPRIDAKMVAFPDFALEDHWNEGTAARSIARGGWTHVVLQQGPSASDDGRALLLAYAPRFGTAIAAVHATPAMYSVWPQSNRLKDFPRASESYRMAAEQIHGLFLPVADAWAAGFKRDPTLSLYAADGLHPSVEGSYLAALVITAVLLDRSPVGFSRSVRLASGPVISFPAETATLLQQVAADAIAGAKQTSVR